MPYLFCFEEQCFAHEVGNMAKMNDLQLIIAVLINCIDPFPAYGSHVGNPGFCPLGYPTLLGNDYFGGHQPGGP
jgi:hypothetical protein